MSNGFRSHRLGPLLLVALLATGPVHAQIVTDGWVGPKVSLQGGEIKIGADLGSRRGDNLFHSFEKFGIATGQTATFTGTGDIKNVISRVTGGEISNIDGKLASTVGQADLYFLNPAGVVFGPNAQLDVPGSFHVSTAHELRFADGTRFSALDKTGSGLTVAPPEAFGFLDNPPNQIAVDQSQLKLQPGKTLSLVSGGLTIDGGQTGTLMASDGVIHLSSVTGPGEVRIANGTDDGIRRGAVRVTQQVPEGGRPNAPVIDVSGPAGSGAIRIRGGQINLDTAWIFADNQGIVASTGGIDVQADTLEMGGGAITIDVLNAGWGGAITIQAGDLTLADTATVQSIASSSGHAGAVRIEAGRLRVIGPGDATMPTGIASTTATGSFGDGGSIMIKAGTVEIRGSGTIIATTLGAGNAGAIGIQANTMLLSGDVANQPARIDASVNSSSLGSGGAITIEARDLEMRDRGRVVSSTSGPGSAGQVTIKGGGVRIQGPPGTGINTTANRGSTGSGGAVTILADSLDLRGSGQIAASTFGRGTAGAITIDADVFTVSDPGAGIVGSAGIGSSGSGGPLEIKAGSLRLSNGAAVSTRSQGAGPSGSITVHASDSLLIEGGAGLSARTAVADADDITIRVGRLFDMNQGQITTSVAGGRGSGGNITASVGEAGLSEGFLVLGNSRIVANALEGAGGNITLKAGQVVQSADNEISATSKFGLSGQVTIQAPQTDPSASLRVLPDKFLDTASLLPWPCAARGGQPASTLINGGHGGLPPDPSKPLHAYSEVSPPVTSKAAGRDHIETASRSRKSGCGR